LPLSLTQTVSQKQTLFSVSGQSEIITIPDEAQVRLGIEVKRSTVEAAQQEANQTISNIKKDLQALGIENKDLRTSQYSISPEHDWQSPNQRIIGYQVNASLEVKISEFEKLNQAIDAATKRGANQVGNITFSLSTDREKELKKQARQEAIGEAKDSARELASLAGIHLGKIVDVQEEQNPSQVPIYRSLAEDSGIGGMPEVAPTQIEPGSTTFNYTVTLSYETL